MASILTRTIFMALMLSLVIPVPAAGRDARRLPWTTMGAARPTIAPAITDRSGPGRRTGPRPHTTAARGGLVVLSLER